MIQKNVPWKAIQRFFEEKASDSENLELLHWLEDDLENRFILKQLHSYWKVSTFFSGRPIRVFLTVARFIKFWMKLTIFHMK